MKNLINYYYNIDIKDIKDDIIYDSFDKVYLLKKIDKADQKRITFINESINKVNSFIFFSYTFLTNKYNTIFTMINNEIYVLVKLDDNYDKNVEFYEMLDFYHSSAKYINTYNNVGENWATLWEKKINKLYRIISDNTISNKKIATLFYYYIGISENALLYLKKNNKNNSISSKLSYAHYRINTPLKRKDFYNPCNFLMDSFIRDLAEYIKTCYYSQNDYKEELIYILKTEKLSFYEAKLLFARIIYPSHFIDLFTSNFEQKKYQVFYNTGNYELFLNDIYNIIREFYKIDGIPWIINQH